MLSGEPLDDDELVRRTGISPRQAVNQVCRALERAGTLRRSVGEHGKLVNILTTAGLERPLSPMGDEGVSATAGRAEPAEALADVEPARSLLVLTCSAAKTPGGAAESPSSGEWPEALCRARATLHARLRIDASRVLPAWCRYRGHFYDAAGPALADAVAASAHILIISGGYGLLRAEERIGYYDNVFRASDWPRGLLEQIMINEARRVDARAVVAFTSVSGGYGQLIGRTRWRDAGVDVALHVTCRIEGGGAMVKVPQALGLAFAAFWSHDLAALPAGVVVESLT